MSEEQTFRTEDNASCFKRATIISGVRRHMGSMKQYVKSPKDFETARLGAFATSRLLFTQ